MQNFNPRVSGLFLFCLGLVYIVILAGGTVRATGAGMGCPDWPLCFGKFIPPTSEAELPENWKNFLHGSQAESPSFNPVHTWTEYLNRLAGALLGFASLALVFFCFFSNKVTNKTLYFAIGALLSVIFNGWLGSQVVASDLRPLLVSLHMIGAFLVQMFLILGFINSRASNVFPTISMTYNKRANIYIGICVLCLVLQIGMGIQIRESVDWVFKLDELFDRENLIDIVPWIFYVHRSFSWVVLVFAVLALSYIVKSKVNPETNLREISTWKFLLSDVKVRWCSLYIVLVLSQMLIGGALNHLGFPMFVQPLHLLAANLMFGVLCFLLFCESEIVNYEKNQTLQSRAMLT
ncbi:COX15/CtaA family protein [Betaproteobacteria bacterium]|nr:COX15/CtaA family protein [Betaproteobacteria bacterium]